MLLADKYALKAQAQRSALISKEKELQLHRENYSNIAAQAAWFLTISCTCLIEFEKPTDADPTLMFCYFVSTTAGLVFHVLVCFKTTMLLVYGTTLAVRGPNGSILTSVEELWAERRSTYLAFFAGFLGTDLSLMFGAWILMDWEAALCSTIILLLITIACGQSLLAIYKKMSYSADAAVTFNDVFLSLASVLPEVLPVPTLGFRPSNLHRADGEQEDFEDRSASMDEEAPQIRRRAMPNS
uniref:Uncharacterized protein n=1 Tax=Pinguiococcus pyrenoidosus TaxID=172671 RepID=A0A7R9Y8V5_9STRA|mmetsp:Transcript_11165/g.41679  ORF Transcript_11165/g.41679 Transcript_11165/m.41679 type:complete len:241 (+) Transcript_11165:174-896(+)